MASLSGGPKGSGVLAGAGFQLVDGVEHHRGVDFVDFEAVTDGAEEGDVEFAAEVFAEFFEAGKDVQVAFRVGVGEFVSEEFEAEEFDKAEDALGAGGVQKVFAAAVGDVEGNADGDGFAVAEAVVAELFEFVRGPVTEVEGAGAAEFKGITAGGDVVHVEFGAAMDEAFHGFGLEVAELEGVVFDGFEEFGVANAGDFDGFDVAGAFVAGAEGGEELEIVHDGVGRGECADEILLSEGVDAIFDADAGIILTQRGGGNADMADAAMGGGRSQADHVEKGAAADADDVGVAVDVVAIDLGMDFGDVKVGVLGALAALDDHGLGDEAELFGVGGEIDFDVACEVGLGVGEGFVEDDEDFVTAFLGAVDHHVAEEGVFGIEHAVGEMDLVAKTDLNGAFDVRQLHGHKVLRWTLVRQIYLGGLVLEMKSPAAHHSDRANGASKLVTQREAAKMQMRQFAEALPASKRSQYETRVRRENARSSAPLTESVQFPLSEPAQNPAILIGSAAFEESANRRNYSRTGAFWQLGLWRDGSSGSALRRFCKIVVAREWK